MFLGHRGRFNGEDIIDIIVRQPATGRFIARHLYNFFVADEVQVPAWQTTPPRDPVAINILGDAFVSSGYDIRSTLRVLFNSDFFKEARFTRVKSPVEVVVGTVNLVGDFKPYPDLRLRDLAAESINMGQAILNPPSVEGWHTGAEWVDSGALVKRINFVADRVTRPQSPREYGTWWSASAPSAPSRRSGWWTPAWTSSGPVEVEEDTHGQLVAQAQRGGEVPVGHHRGPGPLRRPGGRGVKPNSSLPRVPDGLGRPLAAGGVPHGLSRPGGRMITRTVRGRTYSYSHTIGFLSNGGRGFRFPMDLALGPGDELYVLNRGDTDASVATTARITRCTVEEEYLGVIGSFGSEDDQFMGAYRHSPGP